MNRYCLLAAGTVLAGLGLVAPAHAANLLIDGSFENYSALSSAPSTAPGNFPGGLYQQGNLIAAGAGGAWYVDWRPDRAQPGYNYVTLNGYAPNIGIGDLPAPAIYQASAGDLFVNLNFYGNGYDNSTGVYQEVTLAAGTYEVAFDIGTLSLDPALPTSLSLFIDNVRQADFTNAAPQLSLGALPTNSRFPNYKDAVNWARSSYTFTTAGGLTRIGLYSNTPYYGLDANGNRTYNLYALLDNVTLDVAGGMVGAIPEPATWAMMLLGFGLVGGALRRRVATRAFALA